MTDQPIDFDELEREQPEDPDFAEQDPDPADDPGDVDESAIADDFGTEEA